MNKTTKISLIVLIVAIIIIVAVFGVIKFVKSVDSKEAISVEKFKSVMEGKEFLVLDAKQSQFASVNYIKSANIAAKKDRSYQLEFYELTSDSDAISFYNNNLNIFKSYYTNGSSEANVNTKNTSKYTLNTSDKYRVLSRIGNTVLYVSVDAKYKDDVNSIIKDLGY